MNQQTLSFSSITKPILRMSLVLKSFRCFLSSFSHWLTKFGSVNFICIHRVCARAINCILSVTLFVKTFVKYVTWMTKSIFIDWSTAVTLKCVQVLHKDVIWAKWNWYNTRYAPLTVTRFLRSQKNETTETKEQNKVHDCDNESKPIKMCLIICFIRSQIKYPSLAVWRWCAFQGFFSIFFFSWAHAIVVSPCSNSIWN